jgi:hypothetical protein
MKRSISFVLFNLEARRIESEQSDFGKFVVQLLIFKSARGLPQRQVPQAWQHMPRLF